MRLNFTDARRGSKQAVLCGPTRADVSRVERELLTRAGALMAGRIGTFDDLFERIVRGSPEARPVAGDAQRVLLARRAVEAVPLNGLGASARRSGFVPM